LSDQLEEVEVVPEPETPKKRQKLAEVWHA
jgi:hypothetical protein